MSIGDVAVEKDVVLVGAGHAHVGVLREFGLRPLPGIRLTLVTRQVHTPYSGMLPGMVAGHYDFHQVHIDTQPLARFAQARLVLAEVGGLDLEKRLVSCRDRPPLRYDVLSIDIGSTPGGADVPGVSEHAIPVKPIDDFLSRFQAARARIAGQDFAARIAVVGGGAAGVELALSLQARLRRDCVAAGRDPNGVRFVIVSASPTILPSLPDGARRRLERILTQRGVETLTNARVTGIEERRLKIEGAPALETDVVFWTTQAQAAPWLRDTGLMLDERGFIAVQETLQSVSHDGIFAAGDIASLVGHDLPKSGVYAVRQGPYLVENIRRTLSGRPLRAYRPQSEALYLISTGDRYAVGARNGISFEGAWAWWWKDWIDRSFMDRFNKLPVSESAGRIAGA